MNITSKTLKHILFLSIKSWVLRFWAWKSGSTRSFLSATDVARQLSQKQQLQHELISSDSEYVLRKCTYRVHKVHIVPMSILMLTARHDSQPSRADSNRHCPRVTATCNKCMPIGFRHASFRCPQSAFFFICMTSVWRRLCLLSQPAWRGH